MMHTEIYIENSILIKDKILELINTDKDIFNKLLPNKLNGLTDGNLRIPLLNKLENEFGRQYLEDNEIIEKGRSSLQVRDLHGQIPFTFLFTNAIHMLINLGILQLSGGSGFNHGAYSFHVQYLKGYYKYDTFQYLYPSNLLIKKFEGQKEVTLTEANNLFYEAVSCHDAKLFRPSLIILFLSTVSLIDGIIDSLTELSWSSPIKNRIQSAKTKRYAGEKIDEFFKIFFVNNVLDHLKSNDTEVSSIHSMKNRMEHLREMRNNIVHPKSRTPELSITDTYNHFLDYLFYYLGIIKLSSYLKELSL